MKDPRHYNFLKAEALLAEIMANGFSFENINYRPAGTAKRSFRKDIDDISLSGEDGTLTVIVNRDGIYDQLPQGLFHQTSKRNDQITQLEAMVKESRRYRQETLQARNFFQPIDQEIFRRSVMVEESERRLRSQISKGEKGALLHNFWDIPSHLPAGALAKLTHIFPYQKFIKGTPRFTAKALSHVLGREVTITAGHVIRTFAYDAPPGAEQDENGLGVDCVLGDTFEDSGIVWKITICGIPEEEMPSYLHDGPQAGVLQYFETIFMPVDIDAEYYYEVSADEHISGKILGHTLTL